MQKRLFTSILQNSYFEKLLRVVRMWWSHFSKFKPLIRASSKRWNPFSILKTLRVVRKSWSTFSVLKTLGVVRKWWSPFWALLTLKVGRKWRSPFFNFKNFKSRKAVMGFFLSFRNFKSRKKVTRFFFSGHASVRFHMMHEFPGTIFSLSLPTEFLWLHISFFD